MANILKQPLSISAQRDLLQDLRLAFMSMHDTDDSISEDGADKQLSSVTIGSRSILKTSIVNQ